MTNTDNRDSLHLIEDRDFFRSEETLPCQYKLIDADEVAGSNADELFDYSEEIQLLGQLRGLQRRGRKLINELDHQKTPLSQYFSTINQQIELIGHRVFLRELRTRNLFGWTLTDVSLGGAGLLTDHFIASPAVIALRILVQDGAWVLTCFATVRYSHKRPDASGYRSGIEFVDLSGEQQRLLHRYLLSRQAAAQQTFDNNDR